jgi:hypothetical protein
MKVHDYFVFNPSNAVFMWSVCLFNDTFQLNSFNNFEWWDDNECSGKHIKVSGRGLFEGIICGRPEKNYEMINQNSLYLRRNSNPGPQEYNQRVIFCCQCTAADSF